MPLFANTPEAVLPRTDSLDPETTCKGLTSTGKACRRALASPPTKNDPASYYCWQHRDQAQANNGDNSSSSNAANRPPGENRTSIDTLMDRLGIHDNNNGGNSNRPPSRIQHRKRRPWWWSFCCCFNICESLMDEEQGGENLQPIRPSQQQQQYQPQQTAPTPQWASQAAPPQQQQVAIQKNKWIPSTLPAETASLLQAELDKPLSQKDEPGYIYIFWLTPKETSTRAPPPPEILESNSTSTSRSLSDAIRAVQDLNAFTSKPTTTHPGKIRLKIGRASNVQRRLNEWTRQCSYNLTLIRYYPYTSSHNGSSGGNAGAGRKVPYVHRVEHLIHIELGDMRIRDMGKCPECGKEHKEWFEIKAEKEELRRVDECIRRWVAWAENQ